MAASLPYCQRSIELDPNFAMGYRAVGVVYATLGEAGRANEYYTEAFQLREHVSGREKLDVIAAYYSNVTGEVDKAAHADEEEIESYPRESSGYLNLGAEYALEGQYEKAAAVVRQGIRLTPDQHRFYNALFLFTLALQRFDESRQVLRDAQARNLDDYTLHSDVYDLAFLDSNSAVMAEQQRWLAGSPEYENFGLGLASDTEAYAGHLSKARELTKRAMESAIRADNKENAALWQTDAAVQQAAYGNQTEARKRAAEALKLAPASQSAETEAAVAFAMAGDTARAESLSRDLANRFPRHTQMQALWLPAIRGQIALNKKNPAAALSTLQDASAIELGYIPFNNSGASCLYHVYIRGEAYIAGGQPRDATAEFQKIIDHSGIVVNCWTGALAHLGVARANALEAKTLTGAEADAARVRALAAYKEFLNLWKDADPAIPILKAAKAEYAKLQ